MRIKNILLVLALFLTALGQAKAVEVNSIKSVKSDLLKRIQCNRESNTPAGGGLGSLWGCYSQNEEAKLWINGAASGGDTLRNIKFMVVNYHLSLIHI